MCLMDRDARNVLWCASLSQCVINGQKVVTSTQDSGSQYSITAIESDSHMSCNQKPKTSPQAKRHKPSLLFTSFTILTFITR